MQKGLYKQNSDGTVQGYGQAFIFSEDQKLDWCGILFFMTQPNFSKHEILAH
jgi:hypothetical protein